MKLIINLYIYKKLQQLYCKWTNSSYAEFVKVDTNKNDLYFFLKVVVGKYKLKNTKNQEYIF